MIVNFPPHALSLRQSCASFCSRALNQRKTKIDECHHRCWADFHPTQGTSESLQKKELSPKMKIKRQWQLEAFIKVFFLSDRRVSQLGLSNKSAALVKLKSREQHVVGRVIWESNADSGEHQKELDELNKRLRQWRQSWVRGCVSSRLDVFYELPKSLKVIFWSEFSSSTLRRRATKHSNWVAASYIRICVKKSRWERV